MRFLTHFSDVTDPRTHINVKHDFLDVIFLTVSAVLSGAEGWHDIEVFGKDKLSWLKQYRAFENGIPVDDTIARIIRVICPKQLNQAFLNWVNEVRVETGKPQIAIDGKTLRQSYDGDKHTALHSITAWSKDAGLVLAQLKSSRKKNEQVSVLEMPTSIKCRAIILSLLIAPNNPRLFAHWVLDVTFKEDGCRIRKDDGAENVGVIRRFYLNMVRLNPKKGSMRSKLKMAGWGDDFRAELIFGYKMCGCPDVNMR
ncbi:MAG: ISAs1 family transposase [Pseudomonadota bacterium]